MSDTDITEVTEIVELKKQGPYKIGYGPEVNLSLTEEIGSKIKITVLPDEHGDQGLEAWQAEHLAISLMSMARLMRQRDCIHVVGDFNQCVRCGLPKQPGESG